MRGGFAVSTGAHPPDEKICGAAARIPWRRRPPKWIQRCEESRRFAAPTRCNGRTSIVARVLPSRGANEEGASASSARGDVSP
jgi:hypothetical protein